MLNKPGRRPLCGEKRNAFTKKANYAEISKHLPRSKLIYRPGTMLIAITGRSPSRRFNANQNVMVIRHNRMIITRLISPMLLFVAYMFPVPSVFRPFISQLISVKSREYIYLPVHDNDKALQDL